MGILAGQEARRRGAAGIEVEAHHRAGNALDGGDPGDQRRYRRQLRQHRRVGQLQHAVAARLTLAGQGVTLARLGGRKRFAAVILERNLAVDAERLAGAASGFAAVGEQADAVAERRQIERLIAPRADAPCNAVLEHQGYVMAAHRPRSSGRRMVPARRGRRQPQSPALPLRPRPEPTGREPSVNLSQLALGIQSSFGRNR
jgi:hypothetical protein